MQAVRSACKGLILWMFGWLCCGISAPIYAADRHASLYWAKYSPDRFADIVRDLDAEFRDSWLWALTHAHITAEGDWIRWEVEGQLVRHNGMQNHWEVNGVLVARWMRFPWDRWLDTRLAFGEGLSYAFKVPPLEPRSGEEDMESARLLNYLLLEVEVVLPPRPEWSGFLRVHHRSGVAGLFGGVDGGSNFVGLGLRYSY